MSPFRPIESGTDMAPEELLTRRMALRRLASLSLTFTVTLTATLTATIPLLARAQTEVEANTASRAELESLPGLGPALVQRLMAARPFSGWADLIARVPGIRTATATKLSAAGLRVAGTAHSTARREAS